MLFYYTEKKGVRHAILVLKLSELNLTPKTVLIYPGVKITPFYHFFLQYGYFYHIYVHCNNHRSIII